MSALVLLALMLGEGVSNTAEEARALKRLQSGLQGGSNYSVSQVPSIRHGSRYWCRRCRSRQSRRRCANVFDGMQMILHPAAGSAVGEVFRPPILDFPHAFRGTSCCLNLLLGESYATHGPTPAPTSAATTPTSRRQSRPECPTGPILNKSNCFFV